MGLKLKAALLRLSLDRCPANNTVSEKGLLLCMVTSLHRYDGVLLCMIATLFKEQMGPAEDSLRCMGLGGGILAALHGLGGWGN